MTGKEPVLNSKIELHDSTAEKFSQENGRITLTFSEAYVHKSKGRPGVDPGTGWWQPLEMRFEDASYFGTLPEFPEEISTGILTINGQSYDNMLPTDLDTLGEISLYLLFWMNGKYEFTIAAKRVVLTLLGTAEYVEGFRVRAHVEIAIQTIHFYRKRPSACAPGLSPSKP